MKTSKRVFFLILSVLFIACFASGCVGKSSISKNYQNAINYLKMNLYVPDSLIINSAEGYACSDSDEIYYRIVYNAKNRLGLYGNNDVVYISYNMKNNTCNYINKMYHYRESFYKSQKQGTKFEQKYYYKKIK